MALYACRAFVGVSPASRTPSVTRFGGWGLDAKWHGVAGSTFGLVLQRAPVLHPPVEDAVDWRSLFGMDLHDLFLRAWATIDNPSQALPSFHE